MGSSSLYIVNIADIDRGHVAYKLDGRVNWNLVDCSPESLFNGPNNFPVRNPAAAGRNGLPYPPEDFVGLKAGEYSIIGSAEDPEIASVAHPRRR